ncbi:Acyl-coenzyme A thioesterase 8 [Choanephora cucurbitarum]|uniref:Acyl-coenzyme A thioesterase 8 n=1 Tax=Choanephora cucurbitarum TaxID=101091 RepID=A0A1C7N2W0_9FUNG|nr:Acyl-coenzyme A thioesterase 8 [Choanephora cucurbitarum]
MNRHINHSTDATVNKGQTEQEESSAVDFKLQMINTVAVFKVGDDLYQNKELWQPFGSRGGFGGQLVAQALNAGWDTVPESFSAHSIHAYFMLACDAKLPITYRVQRIRDGRSFTTPDSSTALKLQTAMPKIISPESVLSERQSYKDAVDEANKFPDRFPRERVQEIETREKEDIPIEYRQVEDFSAKAVIEGIIQPNDHTASDTSCEDQKLHTLALAYASDSHFLNTGARAHGYNFNAENIGMLTSLDHTIWFHEPVKADEYLLYDMHSPQSNHGRSMVFGKIYTQDGRLVATTAQEGIVRLSKQGQAYHQKIRDNKL